MRLHFGSITMLLWFAGLSFVIVASVFASPAIDYRLVILGSVIPVVEMFFGGPWILHSLLAPVLIMGSVMIVFRGKRLKQRKWLGLPIGMFIYLFLDRAWAKVNLFWWPISGLEIKTGDTPTWEDPVLIILMEVVGAAAGIYGILKYKIHKKDNLRLFTKSGQIQRQIMRNQRG